MTHDRRTFKPIEDVNEILSAWHREFLSPQAVKLYEAVWYKLHNSASEMVWMDDSEASRRSRTLIQYIPAAQTELARAGLMHLNPGLSQTGYELVEKTNLRDHPEPVPNQD